MTAVSAAPRGAVDNLAALPAARAAWARRRVEFALLLVVIAAGFLGFVLVTGAARVRAGADPLPALREAVLPPAVIAVSLLGLHVLLRWRRREAEQLVLPIVGLLVVIGLTLIWRLRPPEAAWQQLTRGWLPGVALAALLIARTDLIERARRDWPALISVSGLGLLLLTAAIGVVDESGARLSLKFGPLPAIQTSELVKLALIVFLAWYIEAEGERAEARARSLGWMRLPALKYIFPGVLYVSIATLALVRMSDFGAILILGVLFLSMLYAGFEARLFWPMLAIGAGLTLAMAWVLANTWRVPDVMQARWAAYLNPWSQAPLLIDGQPSGLTIAEGPGYQIQQGIYAFIAGGATGTGLGFGSPNNVPLAHSDMIFAAVGEELGALGALAVLTLFGVLLMRILRLGLTLPRAQIFERLLVVGIGIHLFTQMFIMAAGTLDLLPLTGITVPFLSQGGVALTVNLLEVAIVLALAQRAEAVPA
jgi:cell division protein FtsW (lipid II flippase)